MSERARLDEHMVILSGRHCYACDTDDDPRELRIVVVNDGVQLTFDVTLEDAIRFRSLIDDGIFDAFNKWPDEKCPACGYTSNQAASAGDHQNCRQFPYFPGERGKSHAK